MTPADLEHYREMKRRAYVWHRLGEEQTRFIDYEIAAFESAHPDIRPLTAPVEYRTTYPMGHTGQREPLQLTLMKDLGETATKLLECEFDIYPRDGHERAAAMREYNRRLRSAAAILLADWNGWDVGKIR